MQESCANGPDVMLDPPQAPRDSTTINGFVLKRDTLAYVQTNGLSYTFKVDNGYMFSAKVPFTFHNPLADTIYIVNCRGGLALAAPRYIHDARTGRSWALDPERMRAADVSYIEQTAIGGADLDRLFRGVPELAIEIDLTSTKAPASVCRSRLCSPETGTLAPADSGGAGPRTGPRAKFVANP